MFNIIEPLKCDFCCTEADRLISKIIRKKLFTMKVLICKKCLQESLKLFDVKVMVENKNV